MSGLRQYLITLPLVAIALTGCKSDEEEAAPERPPAYVRVARAEQVDFSQQLVLTGSLAARQTTPQQFQLTSRIVEMNVSVGDHVMQGNVLARLDAKVQMANLDAARATLAAAEAQLAEAKSVFDRETRLFEQSLTTKTSYDSAHASFVTARAKRDSAKAQLQNAQETLSYTTLLASADGIITASNYELGEVAQAGATAFTIAQDGARDAVFYAPESALIKDPVGQRVSIRLLSDASVSTMAEVREVAPTIDPGSGTVMIKAGLDDTPVDIGLGAAVVGSARGDAVPRYVFPWSALWQDQGHSAVWVVDPETNKVGLRAVTVDSYQSQKVIITDGLNDGDLVVTQGAKLLTPGETVTIQEGAGK